MRTNARRSGLRFWVFAGIALAVACPAGADEGILRESVPPPPEAPAPDPSIDRHDEIRSLIQALRATWIAAGETLKVAEGADARVLKEVVRSCETSVSYLQGVFIVDTFAREGSTPPESGILAAAEWFGDIKTSLLIQAETLDALSRVEGLTEGAVYHARNAAQWLRGRAVAELDLLAESYVLRAARRPS